MDSEEFDENSYLVNIIEREECEKVKKWCEDRGYKKEFVFENRLAQSDKLRNEGNELFKKDEFEEAQQRFLASLYSIDFHLGQEWDTMPKYRNNLNMKKTKVLCNITVCYLKLKDYVATKTAVELGLKHIAHRRIYDVQRIERNKAHGDEEPDDPTKPEREEEEQKSESKLLYLKAQANLGRGFSEDAVDGLKRALELDPQNTRIRDVLKEARQQQGTDRQEAKKNWKNQLLTDEEKTIQEGKWWWLSVLFAKCKMRCQHREGMKGKPQERVEPRCSPASSGPYNGAKNDKKDK